MFFICVAMEGRKCFPEVLRVKEVTYLALAA